MVYRRVFKRGANVILVAHKFGLSGWFTVWKLAGPRLFFRPKGTLLRLELGITWPRTCVVQGPLQCCGVRRGRWQCAERGAADGGLQSACKIRRFTDEWRGSGCRCPSPPLLLLLLLPPLLLLLPPLLLLLPPLRRARRRPLLPLPAALPSGFAHGLYHAFPSGAQDQYVCGRHHVY